MTGMSFQQTPWRPEPKMPVTAYKTYAVRMPPATHTRVATCREVECEHYANGWTTRLDVNTDLGKRQARYIRDHAGRTYTVTSNANGMLVLSFPPGQQCFREHRVGIGRPALYVVRDGDYRGNPTGRRQTLSERSWLDDFGEHQLTLKQAQEKG